MDNDKFIIHVTPRASGETEDFLDTATFLRDNYPEDFKQARGVTCTVEPIPGMTFWALAWGKHLFISTTHGNRYESDPYQWWTPQLVRNTPEEKVDPFFKVEVLGKAYTKKVTQQRKVNLWKTEDCEGEDTYVVSRWYESLTHSYREILAPYAYLKVRLSAEGAEPIEAEYRFRQPHYGVASIAEDLIRVKSNFFGLERDWTESLRYGGGAFQSYDSEYGLKIMYYHLQHSQIPDGADAWWAKFFELNHNAVGNITADTTGLTAILAKKEIRSTVEKLQKEAPLDWQFFQWLQCSATSEKQMNNRLLTTFLQTVGADYTATLKALRKARLEVAPTTSAYRGSEEKKGPWHDSRRAICLTLPGVATKVQEKEAKSDWRKQQTNAGKADGLGINKDTFPKLRLAVEKGDIPSSVFHQPNGHPVNLEFSLWEKALARKGWAPVIYEIAADASRRGTYEKDITPYLMFLFKIEGYLKKHTGRKWTTMPKYVQSQWELEVDDSDNENGTSTKRSAFTPVADNDTGIVTVPYVAVCVSGVRTQWCYARHYHIFEEGFTDPESGGIITKDLEEKLNGRDDYGLCYYTLTGTVTARGYPTFLIIFERLQSKLLERHNDIRNSGSYSTRVHFHRVRPQRSKNGVPTPACRLLDACYQYMAGNIPAKDILAQQGDLIFIQHPNDPIAAGAKVAPGAEIAPVMTFESHCFKSKDGALKLYKSTAKTPTNRLGFLHAPGGLEVEHPEHEQLKGLPAGWYEIRRCRSFEANPVAIWSLTID